MIRIKTAYNYGCEQVERTVEVDDISTLSAEERELLIDLATGPLTAEREEEDTSEDLPTMSAASIIAMSSKAGPIYPYQHQAYPSHTQNLVEHGLFEKDFIIKHKLEALRILSGTGVIWEEQQQLLQSLMRDLGIEVEKCCEDEPQQG